MILTRYTITERAQAFLGTHRDRPFGRAYEDGEAWAVSHAVEVRRAFSPTTDAPFARCIVLGIAAWLDYAEAHQRRYESPVGWDGVLGSMWLQWGRALRGLLNGETGTLDCGTLDALIIDTLKAQGFDPVDAWFLTDR